MTTRLPWHRNGACPLFLAPMARYTDSPFRQLCKEQGADVMVTEFVQCEALLRERERAWRQVDFSEAQRPMGVQIFGSDPARMAQAAAEVERRLRPDFIDLNCGCPAHKVTDQDAGSSLLRDPVRLERIVRALRVAVSKATPVTVKIRIGWDRQSINALEVGQRVRDAGAEALAIHGRTKAQGYKGEADWAVINAVAEALDIPVIGNGSVDSAEAVARLRATSPVAGLMIGRAALGNPWLFTQIKHTLSTGQTAPAPTLGERWATLFRYADLLLAHHAETRSTARFGWMRAKLKSLTHGMPGKKKLGPAIDAIGSFDELRTLADAHLAHWGTDWVGNPPSTVESAA